MSREDWRATLDLLLVVAGWDVVFSEIPNGAAAKLGVTGMSSVLPSASETLVPLQAAAGSLVGPKVPSWGAARLGVIRDVFSAEDAEMVLFLSCVDGLVDDPVLVAKTGRSLFLAAIYGGKLLIGGAPVSPEVLSLDFLRSLDFPFSFDFPGSFDFPAAADAILVFSTPALALASAPFEISGVNSVSYTAELGISEFNDAISIASSLSVLIPVGLDSSMDLDSSALVTEPSAGIDSVWGLDLDSSVVLVFPWFCDPSRAECQGGVLVRPVQKWRQ